MNYNCCTVYIIQEICMRLGMRNNHMDLRLIMRKKFICLWKKFMNMIQCVRKNCIYAWDRKWERNIDMRLTVKEANMYEAYREKKHIGIRVCTITAYAWDCMQERNKHEPEKELHMYETEHKKEA